MAPLVCCPFHPGWTDGAVAQLGERRNRTAEVRGSNPLGSTSLRRFAATAGKPASADPSLAIIIFRAATSEAAKAARLSPVSSGPHTAHANYREAEKGGLM